MNRSSRVRSCFAARPRPVTGLVGDAVPDDRRLAEAVILPRLEATLAPRPLRRFRLQFADAFPGLLYTAAGGAPGSLAAELRAIVDHGTPLVKTLAAGWSARPRVVRHLVGIPAESMGRRWLSNVRALETLLDALDPAGLPGETARDWEQFNQRIEVGAVLFQKPLWRSAAALRWLGEYTRRVRRAFAATRARWLPDAETQRGIISLRQAMAAALRRDAGLRTGCVMGDPTAGLHEALDLYWLKNAGRLGTLARRFADAIAQARAEKDLAWRVRQGEAIWPLLPENLTAADGARLVRPLTTAEELREHGRALGNCLGTSMTWRYLRRCSAGTRFIVAILDARTMEPRSTAEIAYRWSPRSRSLELAVDQHTAEHNVAPSPDCARAVDELLRHGRSPRVRAHLSRGLRLVRGEPGRRSPEGARGQDKRRAVRRGLGEEGYARLLAWVRGEAEDAPPT